MIDETDAATKVFDVTIKITTDPDTGAITPSHDKLYRFVRLNCKHWIYARQQGAIAEEEHWQCRFSYKRQIRLKQLIKELGSVFEKTNIHVETTEGTKQKDWRTPEYYAYIEDTSTLVKGERIYSDKDLKIESKYNDNFSYYPWQQQIINMPTSDRHVIVIHDPIGGTGKSELSKRLNYNATATYLPAMDDAKDMIRAVSNLNKDGRLRDTIIIDIPRAVPGYKLKNLIIAIESIKNGILSEDRYRFEQCEIPNTKVIIMCNNVPDPQWLTADRWQAYRITAQQFGDLEKINLSEVYEQQLNAEKAKAIETRRIKTGYQGLRKSHSTIQAPLRTER